MKEIDIYKIIVDNFHDKMTNVIYKEYPSIYDALHSSEYRKVYQRNFGAICEGFNVAELSFDYKDVPMHVVFTIGFDFEYAEREHYGWGFKSGLPSYPCGNKFSVKPILGIDEISIELAELSEINKKVYKLLWDNIPSGGGGGSREQFRYYCISGMHCEGHALRLSKVKIDKRIVDFFNYLFGMTDQAIQYQLYPELKPKVVGAEQTSYISDDYDYECDDYDVVYEHI